MKRVTLRPLVALLLAVALGCGALVPASAEESDNSPRLDLIQEVAPEVLEGVAEVSVGNADSESAVEFVSDVTKVRATVPFDLSEGITINHGQRSLTVSLPDSGGQRRAERVAEGVVAFDGAGGTTTVPVVKTDGSVQIVTVIGSERAPREYKYQVTGGTGSRMVLEDDGSVSIVDAKGLWVGGVAAPWAVDVDGNDVPTWYSVAGDRLIQHVAFSANTKFPVVADPWLGIALVQKAVWASDLWQYSPTLKVYPTLWARTVSSAARWSAWTETLSKAYHGSGWYDPDNSTMRNQFYCHFDIVRFRAPNKEYWGLDSKIPDRGYWGFVSSSCN